MQHDCRRRGGRGRTHKDTELFILPLRKTKRKHHFDFSIRGPPSVGAVSVLQQVILFMQKPNRFPQRCRVISLFFYMKLGRFSFNHSTILSFCLKPLCTQGSRCLFPWQPLSSSSSLASLLLSHPLRFKCRRRQRKTCVASCLSLTCVGVFVITSSKVRTGRHTSVSRRLSPDVCGKHLGRQKHTKRLFLFEGEACRFWEIG